jgi:GrpB-like predicted nucleotidyltransferase (UPF0157 family)
MSRKIEVVAYDPSWVTQYEEEADVLRDVFGDELLEIHHVGSTAIPGIHAKPIIDIMPIVKDIARVDALNNLMIEFGYVPRGELGITGRRYFRKGTDELHTHHVHAYEPDNPEVVMHLDFRDYMRAHPEEADRYAALKLENAKKFAYDSQGYTDAKADYVQNIIRLARVWRKKQNSSK